MKIKLLSLIAGAAIAATSAYAQNVGVIGVNHADVAFGYVHQDVPGAKVDLYSIGAGVNYATHRDGDFGLDVLGGLGFTVDGKKHITVQGQGVSAGVRPYYAVTPELKVFAVGSIGYQHNRVATAAGKHSKNNFAWGIGAGAEYTIDQIALVAQASYSRLTDGGDSGVWRYGASINYWIDAVWGIGAGYNYADYKHGHGNEVTGTVRYRF